MHTFKNKKIEQEKIKLIEINNSTCAKDIILYMVDNTELSLEDKCPFLFEYLKHINYSMQSTK